MSVTYTKSDSVGRAIVPAPLVSINKNYQSNREGTKRGTVYSIKLTGTLLPFKGSPKGSYASLSTAFHTTGGYPPDETILGGNEDFNHILRKQEALRWLFNEDGGSLEWQPSGGQPPVKCYPIVISIDFSEGQWADRCDYIIELEAPWVFINGTLDLEDDFSTDLIDSSNEMWSFEEIDGRDREQHRVTHEVNAQGKLGYDGTGDHYENKLAWEHAKDFVDTKITGLIDSNVMIAAAGSPNKFFGHYNRIIKIDKDNGTYGVTEKWLLSDSFSYEEKQFTINYDKVNDIFTVTYQGTIFGLFNNSADGEDINAIIATSNIPSDSEARTTATSFVASLINGNSLPQSLSKKTVAINVQEGSATFTFEWNTSDNITFFLQEEVQLSFSLDNLLKTLTYTETVEGRGNSPSTRLSNAKSNVSSEGGALNSASLLASATGQFYLSSTAQFIDSNKGVVKTTWVWTDRDRNSIETTIQTQNAASVLVMIPIPGRVAGPIIQDMNTKTSTITTVTMRSKRNTSQPSLNTAAFSDGIIISDSVTWSPTTGVAERVTRFLTDN